LWKQSALQEVNLLFPAVPRRTRQVWGCADACFAPFEEVCAYKKLGDPIAIRAVERKATGKGGGVWKKKKAAAQTGRISNPLVNPEVLK